MRGYRADDRVLVMLVVGYLSMDHGFLTEICVRMFFSSFRVLPLAEEELLVSSVSPPSVAESLPRMVACNI